MLSKFKLIIKYSIPPIIVILLRKILHLFRSNKVILFEGYDSSLFQEVVGSCKVYGEFGMGQSTKWVYYNTQVPIISAETNKIWMNLIVSKLSDSNRFKLKWIDLGEIYDGYGRPSSYNHRDRFESFFQSIWSEEKKPDVVLIDGRFRVACFFTALLIADHGTIIIFDDYTFRPYYHIVEEALKPYAICGRQAFFKVPEKINQEEIKKYIQDFKYVTD